MVQGAIAPSILSFEIMDVLIQTEMRRRITSAQPCCLALTLPCCLIRSGNSRRKDQAALTEQYATSTLLAWWLRAQHHYRPRVYCSKAMLAWLSPCRRVVGFWCCWLRCFCPSQRMSGNGTRPCLPNSKRYAKYYLRCGISRHSCGVCSLCFAVGR